MVNSNELCPPVTLFRYKSLHSSLGAPLVDRGEIYESLGQRSATFSLTPVPSRSSSNSLHLLLQIISSEVSRIHLAESDGSGAICVRSPLPLISAVSVRLADVSSTGTGKIAASRPVRLDRMVSDWWETGASGREGGWSGGPREGLSRAPA